MPSLCEQLGEVVIVPDSRRSVLISSLPIDAPERGKSGGSRNAAQLAFIRHEHDPFIRVIVAAAKSDTTSNVKSLDDLVAVLDIDSAGTA
jgi:hypothetical protein